MVVPTLYLHSERGGRTSLCRRRLVNVEILQGEESEKWRLETREKRRKERRLQVRRCKIRDGRLSKDGSGSRVLSSPTIKAITAPEIFLLKLKCFA